MNKDRRPKKKTTNHPRNGSVLGFTQITYRDTRLGGLPYYLAPGQVVPAYDLRVGKNEVSQIAVGMTKIATTLNGLVLADGQEAFSPFMAENFQLQKERDAMHRGVLSQPGGYTSAGLELMPSGLGVQERKDRRLSYSQVHRLMMHCPSPRQTPVLPAFYVEDSQGQYKAWDPVHRVERKLSKAFLPIFLGRTFQDLGEGWDAQDVAIAVCNHYDRQIVYFGLEVSNCVTVREAVTCDRQNSQPVFPIELSSYTLSSEGNCWEIDQAAVQCLTRLVDGDLQEVGLDIPMSILDTPLSAPFKGVRTGSPESSESIASKL